MLHQSNDFVKILSNTFFLNFTELTSQVSSSRQSRGIVVEPTEVNFGTVVEGCSYSQTLTLKNMGENSSRFKIKSPPPSTGIKVICTPGLVS